MVSMFALIVLITNKDKRTTRVVVHCPGCVFLSKIKIKMKIKKQKQFPVYLYKFLLENKDNNQT